MKAPVSTLVLRTILVCTLALAGKNVFAQDTVLLKSGKQDVVINPYAYLYQGQHVTLNDFSKVLKAGPSEFVRNASTQEVTYGFYQPRGWCKFTVRNESDQQEWVLRVQQSRVDTVQLYMVRENHEPEKFPITGHFQTISERTVYALHFAFNVPIKKNETITFYLYTERQDGRHATILNFQQKGYFENYEHVFSIAISFICGMIILAGLAGFVLFFFVQQKVYIYYSFYCLSFFILIAVDSGFAHSLISYPEWQNTINTFTTIFYYWIGGWHILLTIEILNVNAYRNRWLYWLGIFSGWLFCVTAVVLLIPPLPEAMRWTMVICSYYVVFFLNAYILYAIAISIARRDPIVYFYLAGFSVTLIVATVLVLADLNILDNVNQNTDYYYFTPLVEILFMVIGLGIHFSRTIKDRFSVQLTLNKTQDQIITIQEDERKRIAQDLHDDVGNSLAAVKNMVIQKRESVKVEHEIDNLISTIRNISHDLMPVDFNQFSLTEIIGHTVNKFKDHHHTDLEFDQTGQAVKIDPLKELVIYRIINEIINNIFKHSKATSAFIQLIYQRETLVVTVEDNGIGIQKSKTEEGIGLRSIRSRAAYINAKLNIESDDKGTLIILEVPYENN